MQQKQHEETIQALERDLIMMEARLHACYCQMGKSLLELAGSEQNAINTLVDEIIAQKKRLIDARSERQCPNCMTFNSQDSAFCKRCGQKLPEGISDFDFE